MSEDNKKIIKELQKQLPAVLLKEEPDRSRILTCFAYEYFLLDMETDAWNMIRQADPEYFKEQVHEDMQNDASMEKVFMTIGAKLMESGYLSFEDKE